MNYEREKFFFLSITNTAIHYGIEPRQFRKYVMDNFKYNLKIMAKDYQEENENESKNN
jgi:hypothetical protein